MFTKKLFGGAALTAITLAMTPPAIAQQTAAAIRGIVTDEAGVPVEGAAVTVTHVPSGTTSSFETNSAGSFYAGGLRVGGPFTVQIRADGFEPQDLTDLVLQPGNPEPVAATLRAAATAEIVVTAARPVGVSLNNGVGSAFGADDLANQPSFGRDITSLIDRDPFVVRSSAGTFNVAGINARLNSLAIDGVTIDDDFGLSTRAYASSRSPIALDAVEAVSVSATDYSVAVGGFQGGLVNLVTKSGTNEFDGSIYHYETDENKIGQRTNGQRLKFTPFQEQEQGFFLRGPIIKDRLFFSVGREEFTSATPSSFAPTDASNQVNPQAFEELAKLIQTNLGFDPGTRPTETALPTETTRTFGKIDWNIIEGHRASFAYNKTEENDNFPSALSFTSAWYTGPLEVEQMSGQVFSDWTDTFSTTFRLSKKELTRDQVCNAGLGPHYEFRLSAADVAGTPLAGLINSSADQNIIAGCDRFRHGNEFADERIQAFGQADLVLGSHLLSGGFDYTDYKLFNLFTQDSFGTIIFNDLTALSNKTASQVNYRNPVTNNRDDGAADWGYKLLAVFGQDEWQVLPNLSLQAGVRYERYSMDTPTLRQDYQARTGESNENSLDGKDVILPRASFRWEPTSTTKVTGGFGLFAGSDPGVWISNAFTPQLFFTSATNVDLTNPNFLDPLEAVVAGSSLTTPAPIDTISPDFEIPSLWKYSLGVEQYFDINHFGLNLGTDYLVTAQVLYSKDRYGYAWRNRAQTGIGTLAAPAIGVAPDGRPIYADLDITGGQNIIELYNTEEGEGTTWAVSLSKEYDNGFGFYINYAHQDIKSVTPGTSSRAVSNLQGIVDVNDNAPGLGIAPFETEHSFDVAFSFEKAFIADLKTRFDLFGTIQSGSPFTYTFDVSATNPLFGRHRGESPFDADPIYIPAIDPQTGKFSDPLVTFSSAAVEQRLLDYVKANNIPTGQAFARNSDRSNWNQQWDFRFQQELPGIWGAKQFVGENKFKFVADIQNVANLLNDEWGTRTRGPSNNQLPVATVNLIDKANPSRILDSRGAKNAAGVVSNSGTAYVPELDPSLVCTTASACLYQYTSVASDAALRTSIPTPDSSTWRIRIGFRYDF